MMEPFSDVYDEGLLNLQSNLDTFSQQESDGNQEQIASTVNDSLNNVSPSDGAVLLGDTPFIGSYNASILIPDAELNCETRSLIYEQRKLFGIVQGSTKRYVKSNCNC